MKVKFLVDNIPYENLKSEWGLAVHIEYEGKLFLLDTGGSPLFADNAEAMGIDLKDIDYAVLSHAHYDHANGMDIFLEKNQKAQFYLREGSCENCYLKVLFIKKYVGLKKGILEKYKNRITFAKGDYVLEKGVYLVPHKTDNLEVLGKKAYMAVKINGKFQYDNFAHEQSLVFETKEGLVIFNSCSHGGADNIINEVMQTFPGKKIYALIGGFHLSATREKEVRALAKRIKETGIERVITGHCTGEKAYRVLRQELGEQLQQIHTGLEIEF